MICSYIKTSSCISLANTLLSLFSANVAIYNEQYPPNEENFDPAEANPKMSLTCLGDRPQLNLPANVWGFNPNGVSLQKLCAKPQYLGELPSQHLGGAYS